MAKGAKVMIGMPVKNEERFIEKSLESILSQTFEDISIVISDNNSEDRTPEILKKFQKEDKRRIKIIRLEKSIPAIDNFRLVLSECKTEYFMWASGHDLWSKNYIEELYNSLKSSPKYVLSYSKAVAIDENDQKLFEYGDKLDMENKSAMIRFHNFMWIRPACYMIYGLMRTENIKRCKFYYSIKPDNLILLQHKTR